MSSNSTLSPARAPPSPPDSPKSRTGINNSPASCASQSRPPSSFLSTSSLHTASVPLVSSLHQHTFATSLSPGLDAATSTHLPSSPSSRPTSSYRSSSVSPNSAAALHRATRRDQAGDTSFELGSEVSSGDVAEAQGLMRYLGFGSPIASPPLGPNATKDVDLEDGEIAEGVLAEKSLPLDPSIFSVTRSRHSSSFSPPVSPRQYRQAGPRLRHDSQLGNAIPSSPEVIPAVLPGKDLEAFPGHCHGSITASSMHSGVSSQSNTPMGNVTPVPISGSQRSDGAGAQNDVDATGTNAVSIATSCSFKSAISSLPSTTSMSSSMSSFHTASSSTGSIPTSVSTSGSPETNRSLCGLQQPPSVLSESQIVISESGTIQLPPPTMDVSSNSGPTCTFSSSSSSNLNPNAAEHIPTSQATSDLDASNAGSVDSQGKSTNVYINGLPPHFPEDQLFELAAPFGEIRSVRSFTRHVGEKESGYGFVLFETVEAADKCINNLRKFRNLHPTFSKQVHKIPGIPFMPREQDGGNDQPATGSTSPTGGLHASVNGAASEPITFKNKMERLADPASTNLYIEGLPLSIDEPSLVALVSPHRIKSSRFFQTRLSNPPRIIAFVRLETRFGAEEVVERLHGRMVRGWNDPGSRISVRFADTSEQRELRRQERTVRGGEESSPARLTIAQAALLNLRGRDQIRAQNIPVIGSRLGGGLVSEDAPTANQAYHDFSSNMATSSYRSGSDYPVQSGGRTLAQTAPYDQPISLPPPASLVQNTQNIDPAMAAILGSLRGDGVSFNSSGANDIDAVYGDWPDEALQHQGGYHQRQQLSGLRNQVLGDVDLNQLGYAVNQFRRGGGVTQARGGFTPREELIIQAHNTAHNPHRRVPNRDMQLQAQQFCHPEVISDPAVADFNVGVGVRGYRTQASTISVPQSQQQSSYGFGGLAAVMEDESQTIAPLTYTRSQILSIGNRMGITGRGRSDSSNGGQQISLQQHDSPSIQAQAQFSSNRSSNDHNPAHVRSTTLPSASTTASRHQLRHTQHSSMSIPKSRNLITDIMRTTTTSLSRSKHTPSSIMSNNDSFTKSGAKSLNETSDIHTGASTYTSEVATHLHNGTVHYYHGKQNNNFGLYNTQPRQQARQLGQEFHQHQQTQKSFRGDGGIGNYDNGSGVGGESGSPPLVSPALTYSSRGSAGTLSPSTPFVGTFAQAPGSGRGIESDA